MSRKSVSNVCFEYLFDPGSGAAVPVGAAVAVSDHGERVPGERVPRGDHAVSLSFRYLMRYGIPPARA